MTTADVGTHVVCINVRHSETDQNEENKNYGEFLHKRGRLQRYLHLPTLFPEIS